MNRLIATAVALIVPGAAVAQDAVPDLTGKWVGTPRAVIFGANVHHPGDETIADPARVDSMEFTYEFDNQDGRLVWGTVWSDPAKKEPVALPCRVTTSPCSAPTPTATTSSGYSRRIRWKPASP
jgi:hypothetical protein